MMPSRSRIAIVAIALALVPAACSGGAVPSAVSSVPSPEPSIAEPSIAEPSTAAPATTEPSTGSAIVGEWVGVHECARIVTMLTDAGLEEFLGDAVYGNELIPGVDPSTTTLKDPSKPCDGAVERQHSHFFTADGAFGSKDFNGQTVDGGTYSLEDDGAIVINSMQFQYQVDGDTLTLQPDPVDISACTDKMCRFYAAWVLMVAMPGTTWTRGEIPST